MKPKNQPTKQVEELPTADLIPYARNAKKHDDAQVAKIAGSIREFGFNNPVLIDGKNGIIAGHGRVMAAQKLGLEQVPCIRLDHLSETQKQAYILADNRLAEIGGGWDMEALKIELEELARNEDWLDFDQMFDKDGVEEKTEKPEVEFSDELMLEHNYIVLYFDDPMDWEVAIEKFNLKTVKSSDSAEKCQKVGIGRVVKGKDFI
jgi:ParB-like chromosome segregation protein Spo0J